LGVSDSERSLAFENDQIPGSIAS